MCIIIESRSNARAEKNRLSVSTLYAIFIGNLNLVSKYCMPSEWLITYMQKMCVSMGCIDPMLWVCLWIGDTVYFAIFEMHIIKWLYVRGRAGEEERYLLHRMTSVHLCIYKMKHYTLYETLCYTIYIRAADGAICAHCTLALFRKKKV